MITLPHVIWQKERDVTCSTCILHVSRARGRVDTPALGVDSQQFHQWINAKGMHGGLQSNKWLCDSWAEESKQKS